VVVLDAAAFRVTNRAGLRQSPGHFCKGELRLLQGEATRAAVEILAIVISRVE
jgi:hypothetical protein